MADRMVFIKTALTGGGAGSLDAIVSTDRGDTNPLQDDDVAFVAASSNLYFYLYDADSTDGESSPTVIRPDDIDPANAGRWLQQGIASNVDDTPADGETAKAISSNWAYDHVAAADPHTGYLLESALAAPGAIGETTPNTIRGKNKEIFKTASADSPLTEAQCCGTIVSNYGMTDADCVIDLPTAVEGLSFVCILPAVRARYFRLKCPTAQADKIYLSGVAGSDDGYVGVASGYASGAAASFFTFKASDGGYDWFCIPLNGTWVAG